MLFVINCFIVKNQDNRIDYNQQKIFLNGSNIAWVDFGADIGPGKTNFNAFAKIFREAHSIGANSMRLWIHANGAVTPEFSGLDVTGPGKGSIRDLTKILNLAYENNIGLILCLWSFDMLRKNNDSLVIRRNRGILTNDTIMESYIKNALVPLIVALKDHPGIIAWEIFNEPEGMCSDVSSGGWAFTEHVSILNVQKMINRCAAAIHQIKPELQVTNGAWSLISATDVEGYTNFYSDERLIAAGGDPKGILDFYCVHHYDWLSDSPFNHPCSYFKWDKPIVLAEFFPECKNCGAFSNYVHLYKSGYAGAMGWDWNGKEESKIKSEIKYMDSKYHDDLNIISLHKKKEKKQIAGNEAR